MKVLISILVLSLSLASCANLASSPPPLARGSGQGANGGNAPSFSWPPEVPRATDAELDAYYASADHLSGSALKTALHNIIKNHTVVPYGSSGTGVWAALMDLDEDPANPSNVVYIYSRRSEPKTRTQYNFPTDMDAWNREHTFPKSRGFKDNPTWPPFTDLHHLRPEDRSVNSSRGDRDFRSGGNPHPEAVLVRYGPGTWEVPDEVKGDIARGIFYMAVRYEGTAPNEPDLEVVNRATTSGEPNLGYLKDLLAWHESDPVDDPERLRNEKIYRRYQGNRNPFVDRPHYVERIWGRSSDYP